MAYRIETLKEHPPAIYTAQYREHLWDQWQDIGLPTTNREDAEADIKRHQKAKD